MIRFPQNTKSLRRWAGLALALPLLGATAQAQSTGISAGLKAYWNFDQNNFQDSVGEFHGTENGTEAIAFVNGKPGFGRAISLDGEDQFVEITGGEPDDLAFEGGSVSIAGWFKVDAFDTSWQALVAKGEGSNWRVARRGEEQGMAYAGGLTDTPTGSSVNDGEWHHFVAISDAEGAEFGTALYINGARDAVIEGAAVLTANGLRMRIGDNPGAPSREWEGQIDDLAIWDRVLTETEIALLYNNGTGTPLNELLGLMEVDTDGDGMPDWWEIQHGLNPNDPGDANLDCDGDGATNLEEYLAGTDPCDTTAPTIASVTATATFDTVIITFSEEVDPVTASNPANYSITPALAVTAVSHDRRTVTLTTAPQTPGATAYTLAVQNVLDHSKNAIAPNTTVVFYSYLLVNTGVLKFSFWGGITGTPVDNLLFDERYPDSPDWIGAVFSFNSRDILPTDSNDNYGATIEGWITPEESGDYYFFLRSDDASRLEISTDATPANLVWQAEEYGCCSAFLEPLDPAKPDVTTPVPLSLVAGQRYFIRVTYKEGGGGDFAQVAWRREGDPTPAASLLPIPGRFLSSAVDLPAPPEGAFLTQTPGPNATGVSPFAGINIRHRDGASEWTAQNVSLKLNGVDVTPTFTKEGNVAVITYQPADSFASLSSHTVTLGFPDAGGNPATLEWSFAVAEYKGPVRDKVSGIPVLLFGAADLTADQGGRTGQPGDLALDTGVSTGVGFVADASFLNAATADDTLTIAYFQKLRSVRASSGFWANSPGSNNGTRGFQAHTPWSDSTIYFDTAGCCEAEIQRISLNIANFPGYSGDNTWWEEWRHFVFIKDGDQKHIYIDGQWFHSGAGAPLPTDFTSLVLGGGPSITENRMDGWLDDFVIYSGALTETQVASLAGGAAPGSISGLLAHWDFNEAPAASVRIMAARAGNQVTVTSEPAALPAGWVLQTAPSVNGPWTTQAGATTPFTITIGNDNAFLRAAQP